MGALLLTCITRRETTKVKGTFCCSHRATIRHRKKVCGCSAESAWEACSSTTIHAQHEYFCHTRMRRREARSSAGGLCPSFACGPADGLPLGRYGEFRGHDAIWA